MPKFNFKKPGIYIIALIMVGFLLVPVAPVHAGWFDWSMETIFGNFLWIIFSMVGTIIGVLATLLNWIIHIPVYPAGGLPVVDESWKIMRDFANMFFIVALIIMAFATIFNISKYDARSLFAKFIIAALLINFSLVIGGLIINASQVLSNTFLTAIGDISIRLGQDLNPSKLLPSEGDISATVGGQSITFGLLISLAFSIVLLFTFLFSLLTAAMFAFIRIPILWALLVVAPIAWLLNIIPAGEGAYKKWWSLFIGWNLFLPIFLFFLYFGLFFLRNQETVIQAIAADLSSTEPGSNVPFTFQLMFFYVLAAVFLIGGTATAMKASLFSGTGVVGAAGWARGRAVRWTGIAGAGQAARERMTEIQAGEGRLGRVFGGPPMGLATARKALGVRGADFKTQKEFIDRAQKEYDLVQNKIDIGDLKPEDIAAKARGGSATNPETYAYIKMAAKMGKLDNPTYEKTIKGLTNNPYALQDFIKTAGEGKFSDIDGKNVVNFAAGNDQFANLGTGAVAGRREAYRNIQSNALLLSNKDFGQKEFETGLSLFGGNTTTEGRKFIEEVAKVRPDLVVNYNLGNENMLKKINERRAKDISDEFPGGKPVITKENQKEFRWEMLSGYLKDEKDIANMPLQVWQDEEGFQKALAQKLTYGSNKEQANYRNRILRNLRTTINSDQKRKILDKLPGFKGIGENRNPGGTPPTQNPPGGVNPNNVVNLRPGERRSEGGIILNPGAQDELER